MTKRRKNAAAEAVPAMRSSTLRPKGRKTEVHVRAVPDKRVRTSGPSQRRLHRPKPALDEASFQAGLIEYAQLCGWLVFHVSDSRKEVIDRRRGVSRMVGDELAKGWPDLTLVHVRRGLFLIRELKSDRGRVRPEQKAWIEALVAVGVDAAVWRPRDWPEIEAVLGGKRQRESEAA